MVDRVRTMECARQQILENRALIFYVLSFWGCWIHSHRQSKTKDPAR
jgi:hypothetical protein